MKGLIVITDDGKATQNRIKRSVSISIHPHTKEQDFKSAAMMTTNLHLDLKNFFLPPSAVSAFLAMFSLLDVF